MSDPDYNIGHVVKAVEDDHGLLVTAAARPREPEGRADLPAAQGSPDQPDVFRLRRDRGVGREVRRARDYFELRKLKTYEVSVVPIGANQETEVLAVKAAIDALAGEQRRRAVSSRPSTSTPCAPRRKPSAPSSRPPRDDQEKASDQSDGQVRRGARKGQVRRGAQLEVVRR
jgi:HK97 family phage prohead protease